MIQLEHLNLCIKNIDASLKFYQAAFPHWKVRCGGKDSWHGKPREWLHFGDDYQYISLNDNGEGENRILSGHQVGLAHFAFVTQDLDGVIKRLAEAGFPADKEGGDNPYRNNIYFLDPDGYEVEFVEYLTDLPELRNSLG